MKFTLNIGTGVLARRPAPRTRRVAGGFTLIEIMVVIAILAILAVVVMPKLVGRTDDARVTAAKVQLKGIEEALNLYKLDSGIYPETEQGLEALVHAPTIGKIPRNWNEGGYMQRIPMDPWGSEYLYIRPGENAAYDLISFGADGEEGGDGNDADLNVHEID